MMFRKLPVSMLAATVTVALVLLALVRPIDHDESQYVAATVLAAHGLLPYRDFAYLQTPLQPLLLAPVAAVAGAWTYAALRIVNAALGMAAIAAVFASARAAGVSQRAALLACGLFACCDILLFSAAVARNDALPAAMLAAAMIGIVRAQTGAARPVEAVLVGLLLAGATAAKISYALPALAVGLYALIDRRHRPGLIALGAVAPALLVAWTWHLAPAAFMFGVFTFPALAPAQYYQDVGNLWKLSWAAKAVDALKFLALGPALLAVVKVARGEAGDGRWRVIDALTLAGLVAALLPEPTWRQYLLPVLPPLLLRLAITFERKPLARGGRIAAVIFVIGGLAQSAEAVIRASLGGMPVLVAQAEASAIGAALDKAGATGAVATLSPQFLPAMHRLPDARFAAGPFYFRSHGLVPPTQERGMALVSAATIEQRFAGAGAPDIILVGGEAGWTSGDAGSDAPLEHWARAHGWHRVAATGHLRAYLPPR